MLYDPGTGAWTPSTFDENARHVAHPATQLPRGRILVVDGSGIGPPSLYDPGTPAWSETGNLVIARSNHTMVTLLDGRVLVAGGTASGATLASAELYDPATGTWSLTGAMSVPRRLHTMALLHDGRVLVAGGTSDRPGHPPWTCSPPPRSTIPQPARGPLPPSSRMRASTSR